jgi:hypothetical protein
MLNATDPYTTFSLQRLKETIRQKRPVVFWIGAGASRWAGLPSWHDSAARMRRAFAKRVPDFPVDLATSQISSDAYPDFFQLCRDVDRKLFNAILHEQLGSPVVGTLYTKFIERLRNIAPIQIVTTNIDLCLEQQLGPIDVIEKADLERCDRSIVAGSPFIAKLHGSISSIESTVFTTEDYQQLIQARNYIPAIRSVFNTSSVIFLGYGLQDEYVLKLIADDAGTHALFGNGPHFLVKNPAAPPENGVHRIAYDVSRYEDHRASLTVIDYVLQATSVPVFQVPLSAKNQDFADKTSGFYISDFKPSGTHTSGQVLDLGNPENRAIKAIVGLGFAVGELPSSETVAFHDLAVGLVCFDRVYLPLESLGLLHERATHDVFWTLIDSGAIKFVDVVHNPLFVSDSESMIGDVGIARIQDPQYSETRSSMSVVRKMLRPAPGYQEIGDKKIESLESHVVLFADSEALNLPGIVRDGLLQPHVSRLLGYSDFSTPSNIPRWLAYPTLRFAHLVQTGLICNQFHIRATRVPFGGTSLLSAAFSITPAEQSVYEYASFVMVGAYGCNLSGYIENNPRALLSFLKFRESAEGEALRREVSDRLETNDGTEFSAAIEGGLRKAIPAAVLQAARNKFSTLLKTDHANASAAAVWADSKTDDLSLRLWREQSRQFLLMAAKNLGLKSDSPCLCGSGDRLRDCCLRALK